MIGRLVDGCTAELENNSSLIAARYSGRRESSNMVQTVTEALQSIINQDGWGFRSEVKLTFGVLTRKQPYRGVRTLSMRLGKMVY